MTSAHRSPVSAATLRATAAALAVCASLAASQARADICGCSGHPDSLGSFVSSDPLTHPPDWVLDELANTISVPLPEDGVLIFESFTLQNTPAGSQARLVFEPNAANTPVTLLVAGDVVVGFGDVLDVRGADGEDSSTALGRATLGGLGGPGGSKGGDGADLAVTQEGVGGAGLGPAGGAPGDLNASSPAAGEQGFWLGADDLLPVTGGSGGGGGSHASAANGCPNGAGGGGGGAILIAANGTIRVDGSILAEGGRAGFRSVATACSGASEAGGDGSGGSIRLVADAIAGIGQINAKRGGGFSSATAQPGDGRIRLEAFSNSHTVGQERPTAARLLQPGPIAVLVSPTVAITAVAGNGIAQPPGGWRGSRGPVDLTLPLPGIVSVEVETTGVPAGTLVDLSLKPRLGGPGSITPIELLPADCDVDGRCAGFATLDLVAGQYVLEAEATFATP